VPIVRCHVHPQVDAYLTALLDGPGYQLVPTTNSDISGDPAALILTVYKPSASEHRSHAGIQHLVQWRRDGEQTPAVVCAFRSKEHLLRFPANALLREPGTAFMRLPGRQDALLAALESAEPLSEPEREDVVQRACTAWGQLAHYADRLIEAGHRDDGLQVAFLRDFAQRRFGEWLDAPLAQAAKCRSRGDAEGTADHLREAKARAPEAVVYRTFGKLAHGREADLSNKGLGPLRAMLRAKQQGFVGDAPLDELLASDSWSSFKRALQGTVRTLTLLQAGSPSLPDALREQVNTFVEQFDTLADLTETGAIRERPASAVEAIDGLQAASRAILSQRAEARRRMTKE